MRVLAVGIATLDIINRVSRYPAEDDEVRALSQQRLRGGNATNTLVVLSQRGHACDWAGMIADEPDSRTILADLERYRVGSDHCRHLPGGKVPTSYVALSEATGSRTIIHYRDLPEYPAEAFADIDLSCYDWIHFEGRNVEALAVMLERTKRSGTPCSLEVEKPREGIEALFAQAGLLLFSRQYARHRGFDSAQSFLSQVPPAGCDAYCAWGDQGAWLREADGGVHHSPAFAPTRIQDTLGAGDVFNAGIIDARLQGMAAADGLAHACRLAGRKCGQLGFDGLMGALL